MESHLHHPVTNAVLMPIYLYAHCWTKTIFIA